MEVLDKVATMTVGIQKMEVFSVGVSLPQPFRLGDESSWKEDHHLGEP